MKKRIFVTLLALALALGLTVTAAADDLVTTATDVSYVDADGTTKTCPTATLVTNETTTWNEGWYVVRGNVEITSMVTLTGDVKLILCDDAELKIKVEYAVFGGINKGIHIKGGSSLTIYGQTGQTGKLSAECVGSGYGIYNSGTLTINGGTVVARSEYGIGVGAPGLPASYKWRKSESSNFTTNTCAASYAYDGMDGYVEIVVPGDKTVAYHDFGAWVDEIPATCAATGTKGYKTCSRCNGNFDAADVEIADLTIQKNPTNHTQAGVWSFDSKNHWMTYPCCNAATDAEPHRFNDRTCTVCGYEEPAHQHVRRQNITAVEDSTDTAETTVVFSPKTFDTGIAVYGAMAIAAALGMGYVGKKRV